MQWPDWDEKRKARTINNTPTRPNKTIPPKGKERRDKYKLSKGCHNEVIENLLRIQKDIRHQYKNIAPRNLKRIQARNEGEQFRKSQLVQRSKERQIAKYDNFFRKEYSTRFNSENGEQENDHLVLISKRKTIKTPNLTRFRPIPLDLAR